MVTFKYLCVYLLFFCVCAWCACEHVSHRRRSPSFYSTQSLYQTEFQEVTNMGILVQKSTLQVSGCSGREHQKEEPWVHYPIECAVGKGELPFETMMTNIGPPQESKKMGFLEHSSINFSCLRLHDESPREFLFRVCPVYNPYYKELYYHCHLWAVWRIQSHIHSMASLYCSFMKIYRYQCLLLMDLAEIPLPGKMCCKELSQSFIWQLWYHIRKIWLLK